MSIAGGSAQLLLARTIASAATFAVFLILARALSPGDRGAVAFVMMSGIVLAGISGLGLAEATTVFAARRVKERSRLAINLGLFVLAAAALAGGAWVLLLTEVPRLRPDGVGDAELVATLAGTIGIRINVAAISLLLGCGRIREQAFVLVAPPATFALLLLSIGVSSEISIRSACLGWAAAQLWGACAGIVAATGAAGLARPSGKLFREVFSYGVRAWGGQVAGMLNLRVDQVIMGLISTETALGFYAVAANASEVARYLPTTVSLVTIPLIAAARPEERVETTLRTFRILLLLTGGVVAVGFACSPLIPLVFGSEYEPSVGPFLWLLPGSIAFVALSVFTSSLLASSAPARSTLGPVIALVVGVALDLALIPGLDATGAAIASTVSLVAGGTAAAVAYIRLTGTKATLLLPRRGDLFMIRGLVRRSTRLLP